MEVEAETLNGQGVIWRVDGWEFYGGLLLTPADFRSNMPAPDRYLFAGQQFQLCNVRERFHPEPDVPPHLHTAGMRNAVQAGKGNRSASALSLIHILTSRGIGILYISHRMEEIFQMSDRVMVMRDGKGIATMPTTEVDSQQIISLMVGREIKDLYPQKCKPGSKICFSVEGLETERLHNISFEVKEGEILGLFGLMGCGRTDIARAIFGADPRKSGKMCLDGKDIAPTSPFLARCV